MVGVGVKSARRTLIAIRTVRDLADQSSRAVGNGGQFVEPMMSVAKRSVTTARASVLIGSIAQDRSPSPWMISRRRWGDGGERHEDALDGGA
jgi:hypothetical protein